MQTTIATTTKSQRAATLDRVRAIVRAAGHRPGPARARLNLADIRERRAAAQRKARTLARFDHHTQGESYIWEIDWKTALV